MRRLASIPGQHYAEPAAFVVELATGPVAFLDRSTHLGCRLVLVVSPDEMRRQFLRQGDRARDIPRGTAFWDPCGGSAFAADGSVLAGPAPRSLDRLVLTRRGGDLIAHLDRLQRGQVNPRSKSSG